MSAARALVTGATGFIGSQLVRELGEHGFVVTGVGRSEADVTDPRSLRTLVAETLPTHVFHLAGLRAGSLDELLRVNVLGTANLLEAVAAARPASWVFVAGSAAEYGAADRDPLDEETPLEPRSDYGVSKASQGIAAAAAGAALGVAVARLRLFNLIGPGEPESFVVSGFAGRIAAIEAGRAEPPVRTGDLSTRRDFVDVRDAVRAMRLAASSQLTGVYNVCSGRATAVGDVLRLLLEVAHLDAAVESTPEPVATNVRGQRGDPSKLREASGWTPQISLRESVTSVLSERRRALAQDVRT